MNDQKLKLLGMTAAILLPFVNPAGAVPTIGPNGNSYEVIAAGGITWVAANAAASALSSSGIAGHLATVCDTLENDFINGLRVGAGLGQVWLGGYQDPGTETVATAGWTWVNGEGTFPGSNGGPGYANWQGGEPNDYYGVASEQYLGIGLSGTSTWNDEKNLGNIQGYVVEYGGPVSCPDTGSTMVLLGGAMTFIGLIRRRLQS